MKTFFVINPASGQGKKFDDLIKAIESTAKRLCREVEIYSTKAIGDAETFVRETLSKIHEARFVACGGDGTFCEVLNGAMGYDKAEIGLMPYGTGNDFCRNFPENNNFFDIEAQILGKTEKCDAIRYITKIDDVKTTRYCANMFNIGFDCNVADLTGTIKQKPFISGPMAYFISVLCMLIKKKGANLKIEIDGKLRHKGPLLLTSLANGCYCGGGIKSNPLASIHDGLININIINNVSRLKFLHLLPYYMKGTHTKLKNIEDVILTTGGKEITITPKGNRMKLCTDGEISEVGATRFEIVKDAFSFVIPKVYDRDDAILV